MISKDFIKKLLSEDGSISSKRFIMLVVAIHFIVGAMVAIPLLVCSFFGVFHGNLEVLKLMIGLFESIMEKEFIITLFTIGAMSATSIGSYVTEKARAIGRTISRWGKNDDDEDFRNNNWNDQQPVSRNIDTPENP